MNKYVLITILIAFFGLFLRLFQYDKLPVQSDTQDEVMYTWAGQSFLTTGVPKSWTAVAVYNNYERVTFNSASFLIVSPWLEKPPLYSLLSGFSVLLLGQKDIFSVTLSAIRILPLILSFISIILVGLTARKFFNDSIGYISAIIYASIPTIVIGNRLSVAENFLIPLVLLGILLTSSNFNSKWEKIRPFLIAITCAAAILSRQTAIALPIAVVLIFTYKKKYKSASIVGIISALSFLVYPLIGIIYDAELFLRVIKAIQESYSVGIPDFTSALLRYPVITQLNKPFFDASIILGYILLFSSPFWFKEKTFIIFPLVFILILSFFETGTLFYGWHLYPVFPFLAIILGYVFYNFYQKIDIPKTIVLTFLIGLPSIKTFLTMTNVLIPYWQIFLIVTFILIGTTSLFKNKDYKQAWVLMLFTMYVSLNCLTVINFRLFYPY